MQSTEADRLNMEGDITPMGTSLSKDAQRTWARVTERLHALQ